MNIYLLTITLFASTFLIQYILQAAKNKVINLLSLYLAKGDRDSFDRLIQKKIIRYLIPKFDIMYLILNSSMMFSDIESVKNLLSQFNDEKMSNKQKELLYSLAFNYFVSMSDKHDAKRYYDNLASLPNIQNRDNYEIIYDIYVEDGYQYLNDMLVQFEECENAEKPHLCLLIAKMYENKGDLINKKLYEDML